MRARSLGVAAAAALALAGCGGAAPAARLADPVSGALTVFAAASLTAAFDRIGRDFTTAHPAAAVRFDYGGSSTLAAQILQGAPADVFASADHANMQKLVDGGVADGTPSVFAHNSLQVVVQAGNPQNIAGLADLARPGLVVDLCAPAVPCGAYAAQALARAGVRVTPKSQEQDVKAVVTRVSLGEADAGIVYATDVRAGGASVQGVDVPAAQNVVAEYPLVRVRGTAHSAAANAFIDWVLGARGQAALAQLGFGAA